MKRVLRVSIFGFAGLLISLLLARVHPFGDPELYAKISEPLSVPQDSSVPPEVREILNTKCADCHSLRTRAPLYGRFAPASWLMERDIVDARRAMNLSLWESYPTESQQAFKSKILHEIREHEMPPLQYRAIHANARVTDADVQAFARWAHEASVEDVATDDTSTTQELSEGDPARGKAVFLKRCTGCHALDENREGPRLRNVYGRTSGTVANFDYSATLKKAHIIWDEKTLDKWLTDPDAFLPGNNMDFHVAKPQERRDLIRFFKEGATN
jgi:cytochrome c